MLVNVYPVMVEGEADVEMMWTWLSDFTTAMSVEQTAATSARNRLGLGLGLGLGLNRLLRPVLATG